VKQRFSWDYIQRVLSYGDINDEEKHAVYQAAEGLLTQLERRGGYGHTTPAFAQAIRDDLANALPGHPELHIELMDAFYEDTDIYE
jgi:hypothetical protein